MTTQAIVTIGNFDGVHLGHQMLLRQVVDRARVLGLRSFAVTFDPHPEQILFPDRPLPCLSSAEEKQQLIYECGIDDVWVCPFTTELSRLEPHEFMRLVSDRTTLAELWVGADFALGRGRSGTISVLAELGANYGWGLHMVPPYRLEGQIVSSTGIRTLLATGALQGAAELLGRPYVLQGELQADGTLRVDPHRAFPKSGMPYEALLQQDGQRADVIASVQAPEVRIKPRQPTGLTPGKAKLAFLRRVR